TLTIDDTGTVLGDDPPALVSQQFTCWEFTITPCDPGWKPQPYVANGDLIGPDFAGPFQVELTPSVDHHGNSMADYTTWTMLVSQEPGFCLNSGDAYVDGTEIVRTHDASFELRVDHAYT